MNPAFKSVIAVVAVVAPLWWLIGTDDGRRRTDMVMLEIFGDGASFDIHLNRLSASVNESGLRNEFPDLPLQCQDQQSPYGDRICLADISSFNGTPAAYAAFYLRSDRLQAMKMSYQPAYHEGIHAYLDSQLGAGQSVGPDGQPLPPGVVQWRSEGGVYMAQRPRGNSDEETALMWLAAERVGLR